MKKCISLALFGLFLVQSAIAAEQPTPKKDRSWKRVSLSFIGTGVSGYVAYRCKVALANESIRADELKTAYKDATHNASSSKNENDNYLWDEVVDIGNKKKRAEESVKAFEEFGQFFALLTFYGVLCTYESLQAYN
jgi:hypothetical protein